MGMEAEFSVLVDGEPTRPEDVFGSPRAFVRGNMMHRQGTSYHLPTGGAVYFDTGVIEVATPVIEIERGAAARAGRSLWESILYLREELDHWESRTGREIRLTGFSTHYNVSFELPLHEQGRSRTVRKLALLLSYILPAPVMLLATNKRSTGVGVRPRGDRIEITVDFTPSASLMIATGTLIVGIVREVMTWPSFELDMLEQMGHARHRGVQAHEAHVAQGMAGAQRLLSRGPVRRGHGRDDVAHDGRAGDEPAQHRGAHRQALLAPHPPRQRPVDLPAHRLGDAGAGAEPAGPGRPAAGVRGRGPAVHLGQPVPRERSSAAAGTSACSSVPSAGKS